ncbi:MULTISPECIES: flagellar basal body rod protein FlgB [Methylophaga]|uniref:flagellar basal body rod protein FlgB n=1 Tax=Methylophaga lonarensis TaxID=999151 RepID=UPI002A007BB5|nr:flagellar basal body rod protein FlgB [Methylophaga sp.]
MPINFDSALGIHADALRVRSQRAELLATNLANADTPNYKARDIDFQSALKMAASGQTSPSLNTTHQKHIAGSGGSSFDSQLQYRQTMQDSLDGNTVDEQVEQSQFMQNAVQYQASLEFLGSRFQSLTKAIRGE